MDDDVYSQSGRPRRTRRHAAPLPQPVAATSSPARHKRKAPEEPADRLEMWMSSPKSPLATLDMSTVINAQTWRMLSPESRARLSALLPPTALPGFAPTLSPFHPSRQDAEDDTRMDVDTEPAVPESAVPAMPEAPSADGVDTAVFTDSHFIAALHTFQDHLCSGWLSEANRTILEAHEKGVRDGTLHAPWKDEVWEKENGADRVDDGERDGPDSQQPRSSKESRSRDAAGVSLADLAKNDFIREGDVLAYRRFFVGFGVTVEKDVLIHQIHPTSRALTVLVEPGSTRDLPPMLLSLSPSHPSPPTRSMTVTSPTMLENGLLDIDNRTEKARRPNGNAWKSMTVFRWNEEKIGGEIDVDLLCTLDRGGRESHGTLFYLRSCSQQEG